MEPSWKTDLNSTDPNQRLQGIKSLVQTQDPRALPILKHLYDHDPDATVRDFARKGARYLYQKTSQDKSQTASKAPAAVAPFTDPDPAPAAPPEPDRVPDPAPAPPKPDLDPGPDFAAAPFPPPIPAPEHVLTSLDRPAAKLAKKTNQREIESANQKLQQALTQQMRGNDEKAVGYIAAAFKLNPDLREDTFAVNLACSLTGLPREGAIAAILDQTALQGSFPAASESEGTSSTPAGLQHPAAIPDQDFGEEKAAEQQTRELLETLLLPGEKLLAYSGGGLPGLFASKTVAVGLTSQGLLLQALKRGAAAGVPSRISRELIQSIKYSGLGSKLEIKVPGGVLVIVPKKSSWKKRLKMFPGMLRLVPSGQSPQNLTKQALEGQITAFEELGLINAALELSKSSGGQEELAALPAYQGLLDQRFSYQVAAGFLLINVAAAFFFSLVGLVSGLPVLPGIFISAVIDILIGVNLWKGQTQPWAGWAMLRAALGAVLYGILYLGQGLYLDLLAQISFCGAIILVLTGPRDRLRTYTAIGIYAIGYLAIVTITFLFGLLSGLGG